MKTGIELIAQERQRQIEKEGYSIARDLTYEGRQLIMAAHCYLQADHYRSPKAKALVNIDGVPLAWPWNDEYWKPTPNSRVRELVKAGALIAAEIDRLQATEGENEKR